MMSWEKNYRDMSKGTKKIMYDISGKPYISCPRCSSNFELPAVTQPSQKIPEPAATTEGAEVKSEESLADKPDLILTCPSCSQKMAVQA